MHQPPPRRLDILICLLYYVPHRTGLTMHVQRLATELVKRGHAVTVLTARHRHDLPRDERLPDGVRVVRLRASWPISRGMVMPAYPWAAWRLMRQHDVVSIHTPMLETALVAALSKLTGRGLVITHHGDLRLPAGALNRVIQQTMFRLYTVAARQATRILGYNADYAAHSYYLAPFRDKLTCNFPPMHMPPPDPARVAALRAQWRRNGGPLVGFAHRFVEEKRPDLAIRAMDVVAERHPDARLIFAGQHLIPYERTWRRHAALVRHAGDRLAFVGPFDDRQDMADFYAACDVLVLTSDSDCFGLATVESMLCGTPVVTTDIPGARVPVTMTGMGTLAPKGDWRAIGRALIEVLDDLPAFRRPREVIEETFSLDRSIDVYEEAFHDAANGR